MFVAELGRQCNGVNDLWRVFILHLLEFQFIQHQVSVLIQMRMLAKVLADRKFTVPGQGKLQQAGILDAAGRERNFISE